MKCAIGLRGWVCPQMGPWAQAAFTPVGLVKVKEAHAFVFAIERQMLAQLTAAEKAQLAELLYGCSAALEGGGMPCFLGL